jgi:hypothetical protein
MWFLESFQKPLAVSRAPAPVTTTSPRVLLPILSWMGIFLECLINSTAVNLHRETGRTGIAGADIETLRFARGSSRLGCVYNVILSQESSIYFLFPFLLSSERSVIGIPSRTCDTEK